MEGKEVGKASFLGLGAMGWWMCKHLVAAGYEVTAWNRTAGKTEELRQAVAVDDTGGGGSLSVASTAKEAICASPYVLMMLFDAEATRQVLNTLDSADYEGRTFVVHSTISPEDSQQLHDLVQSNGGIYMECPVLGNNKVAKAAKLQVMAACDHEESFQQCKPLLAPFGTPKYVGTVPQATTMKLALNNVLLANLTGFATSFGLVERAGVNKDLFMEVLNNGPFSIGYHNVWRYKFENRDYSDFTFSVEGGRKDSSLVLEQVKKWGLDPSYAEGALKFLDRAVEEYGLGPCDLSSVYDCANPRSAPK
ncbi:hypothetical protein QOT17_000885 [Balamuthia mandrillaris]